VLFLVVVVHCAGCCTGCRAGQRVSDDRAPNSSTHRADADTLRKVTSSIALNRGFRYDHFSVSKKRDGGLYSREIDPLRPQLGPGVGPYQPVSGLCRSIRSRRW
jgi:hypothetical protein